MGLPAFGAGELLLMIDASPSVSNPTNQVEIVSASFPRGGFRAAIFDFDGTLSLLRRNWQDVMIPMMVDILQATGTPETRASRCGSTWKST